MWFHETQVQQQKKCQCFFHATLPIPALLHSGQQRAAKHYMWRKWASGNTSKGCILTGIDDGVHLQDRDVPFVERHFIIQASSASQFLCILFFIIWKRTTAKKLTKQKKKRNNFISVQNTNLWSNMS